MKLKANLNEIYKKTYQIITKSISTNMHKGYIYNALLFIRYLYGKIASEYVLLKDAEFYVILD